LVPLGLLAKRLDFEGILTVSTISYDDEHNQKELKVTYLPEVDLKGKKILLIDEIADSGVTLQKLRETFTNHYQVRELKIATLVVNKAKSAVIPDFSVLAGTGEWIHFPWELK
jgi:hypoxanthine phosphoribosyltransferase